MDKTVAMKRILQLIAYSAFSLLLACGQKGDLYLPDKQEKQEQKKHDNTIYKNAWPQ